MNELPSSEFRRQYAKLKEPTVVTVNGHAIGDWRPGPPTDDHGLDANLTESLAALEREFPRVKLPGGVQARQVQRDDLLRKINRGK